MHWLKPLARDTWAWTSLLAVLIAGLDAVAPASVNVAVLYAVLVLACLGSPRESYIFIAAGAGTFLSLAKFFGLDFQTPFLWEVLANRGLAIGVIWMTVILGVYNRRRAKGDREAAERLLRRATETVAEQKDRELVAAQEAGLYTLGNLAEARDVDTGHHIERVRAYCQILALELRKDPSLARVIDDQFVADLYRSSPLHDIGKVVVPDAVLSKPGRLTREEYELMKMHTVVGANVLEDSISRFPGASFLEMAALIARYHHERFDGQGYPSGLSGRAIPLPARIVALADVFDALICARPYKEAFPPEKVRDIIVNEAGRQFDPLVVAAFQNRYHDFLRIALRFPGNHTHIFGITESILEEINA